MIRENNGWYREPIRHGLASKGIETSFGKLKDFHEPTEKNVPPIPDWDKIAEKTEETTVQSSLMGQQRVASEMRKAVKLFWWCSVTGNWEYFDFDEFYKSVAPEILPRTGGQISDFFMKNVKIKVNEILADREPEYEVGDIANWMSPEIIGLPYDCLTEDNYEEFNERVEEMFDIYQYEDNGYVLPKEQLEMLSEALNRYEGDTSGGAVVMSDSAPQIYLEMIAWSSMSKEERINMIDKMIDFEHMRGNLWGLNIEKMRNQFEEKYL